MALLDHVKKKGSYDSMDENLSYLVTTLPNVMLIGLTEVEIKRFFFT